MEIQPFNIDKIKEMVHTVERSNMQLETIIRPFMADNLTRKNRIELYQVGKFISLLDAPASIVDRRESPDFIITYNGELIGLEHESIIDEKIASDFRSITDLFNDASKLFLHKYPDIKLLANIYLSTERLIFKKHERAVIIENIVDFMSNYINDHTTTKPYFIERLNISKHSGVNFIYNPGIQYVEFLKEDRLISAIAKKERKIFDYIQNSKIQKQWLLLTLATCGPDSFEYGDFPFQIKISTDYDRIYLLEDIHSDLWRIK